MPKTCQTFQILAKQYPPRLFVIGYGPRYVREGGPSASLPVAGVNTCIPFKLKLAMTVRADSDDSHSNHARASCEVSSNQITDISSAQGRIPFHQHLKTAPVLLGCPGHAFDQNIGSHVARLPENTGLIAPAFEVPGRAGLNVDADALPQRQLQLSRAQRGAAGHVASRELRRSSAERS